MNTISTLGEVRVMVEELSEGNWDEKIPVQEISFDSLETLKIGSETHPLRQNAQRQICTRLGVPMTYLDKCPVDLQAENLNHWIREERNTELFLRFKGNDIRAIFTPRYQPIDHLTVLDQLHGIGYQDHQPVQMNLDEEFLMLNLMEKEKSFLIQKGDKMTPGISIGNSEIGIAALSVAAFVLRLLCTNGLISTTAVESSYRHISHRILEEFPQVIHRLGNDLGKNQDRFRISMESEVKDPDATIRSFNRQFSLNEKEVEAAFWGFAQESGQTMFHVVNGYTKGAQYDGIIAESSYRLQKVGGSILALMN